MDYFIYNLRNAFLKLYLIKKNCVILYNKLSNQTIKNKFNIKGDMIILFLFLDFLDKDLNKFLLNIKFISYN